MKTYKITEKSGEGAHGYVYRGLEIGTNKVVALKKIFVNIEAGIPKNTLREICSLRVLKARNIVRLFDVTSMGSSVVLVMEYLPCNLQEVLKKTDLNLSQIKTYSKMLLKGVEFMHKNHIMHRDIKPANLMISPKKVLKIADFGLARIYNELDSARQYSHQVATRWYRAPELLYGARNYTPSVDIWSVGCIIAEMINNAPLFPGETDIEQLAIVLSTLGSPTDENWPDLKELPDYNKISFVSSPSKPWMLILPSADASTMDLLRKIIIYNSKKRLSAKQCLAHHFFVTGPIPAKSDSMPDPNDYKSDSTEFDPKDFDEIIEQINKI
ncbi:unnamed protein product [Ceutorhynchus assimilis]|uniref:Cyclin-dependent kinase 20 n=1 Tax=Ceutorhynchus assimilis TaxID=467358 RepID=A0A9N9MJR4_9CUCU|nr:unnamed protein product [Ceutorhynchus assimilis]